MTQDSQSFEQLGLNAHILDALKDIGYETPSPIQAQAIPVMLDGRDILGQAQTGTGKTAAFALPLLQLVDVHSKKPQVLVLAPTRELAIQVAEAFQSYAHFLKGFHVLPVYGGQAYDQQIRALKRGVQIVVGTPGRVMDHMRKGTLKLDGLKHLVLDEADEMLRMGFIDDVEWILDKTPDSRQIALFSATMPKEIARVANTYLQNPEHVKVAMKTTTATTIRQRYWPVGGVHKLDALTRILEAEPFEAAIIFVRTKTATVELAEKLEARGHSSAALNGDISQNIRERTVERLKNGKIDILIATDVAARGLDVERITHVINYDIPYDSEAYTHRIGRTGRAGRTGDAILFVARREQRMLRTIERATGKAIEPMKLPSVADINEQRKQRFKQQILDTIAGENLDIYYDILKELKAENDNENEIDPMAIAAALAKALHGEQPLFLQERPEREAPVFRNNGDDKNRRERKPRREHTGERVDMTSYRLEVGKDDGVKPGNIVGALANEADISSQYIQRISIHGNYSTVDLPAGMPKELLQKLKKVWVCKKQLNLSPTTETHNSDEKRNGKKPFKRSDGKKPSSKKPRKRPSDKKPRGSEGS